MKGDTISLNNTREQAEDTILEQENAVLVESDSSGASSQLDPDLDDLNGLVHYPEVPVVSSPEKEPSLDCFVLRDTTDDNNCPDNCGNCHTIKSLP